MREVRITDLPSAGTLTGDELTIVVQNGVSKKSSVKDIVDNASSDSQYWATVSQSAATSSSTSANESSLSADQAQASATSAQGSQNAAEVFANAAQGYSTNAHNSAVSAGGSAVAASNSALAAADSSAAASGFSILAGDFASQAISSANAASASASAAAASYDSFDDRYLGAKSVEPTTDNDGNPLIIGALYWNIPDGVMKAWTGTSWTAVSSVPGYYMVGSNNLSDLTNFATARTNLGLGSSAVLNAGAANGVATLDAGGKLPTTQLPPLAITDVFVVSNQAAMLALDAQTGDVAIRTDLSQNFILAGLPASTLANWQVLLVPPDSVTSVNGKVGVVVLTYSDVGAPSVSGTNATGTWGISITGNAATVTNGVYTDGSYSNPTWITSIAGSKVSGNISGSAGSVANSITFNSSGTGGASGSTFNGGSALTVSYNTIGAYAASNPSGFTSNTGTVTSVGGTGSVSGLTLSGTVTTTGNLTLGGTLSVTPSNFASQTANTFLAAPNGTAGTPTFRTIVAADVPTLNQNTTGTASNVTGIVAIANGGSGQNTAQLAMNAFAGAVTSGSYLRGNGTNVVMSTIQAADVPTLNQNTTGTASNVTGTVAIGNGGTGQTTATAAFGALAPTTTLGDTIYHNGTNNVRLAGNTTTTKKHFVQAGTGTVSAAPAWNTCTVPILLNDGVTTTQVPFNYA